MSWQEEHKQRIAEREEEQEQLRQGNEELQRQLDRVRGTLEAVDTIGSAQFGRAA